MILLEFFPRAQIITIYINNLRRQENEKSNTQNI